MDAEAHELIAAYALDALDDVDRARVEELLASSPEAREELSALSDVSAALAVGAGGPAPRPELRERILEAARSERTNVVSFEQPARRSRLVPALTAIAAVAAVAALAFAVWGISASRDLDEARVALDEAHAVNGVLADPSAQSVALAAGTGQLVVGGEGEAVLVVDGLAEAPSGKAYQVWIVDGGAATPAGSFSGGGERDVVPVVGAVGTKDVVAVTVEDAGGAEQPTSAPIVASDPV